MHGTVLVAGASGQLGRHVVARLRGEGIRVRALARAPERLRGAADEVFRGDLTDPDSLRGACDGVEAVVSCAGASMRMDNPADRRSFREVDHLGNRALLAESRRAGVRRWVYVSLFGAERLLATEYARAHEAMVAELRGSGIDHSVIRPTGLFSFLGELVRMARRGPVPVLGDGSARSNPVHEADVAEACLAALHGGPREVPVGGPEVLTRRRMAELACEAVGREPRLLRLPFWTMRGAAWLARPVSPRMHDLLRFGVEVSRIDVVAPARGTRDLRSYFEAVARGRADDLSAAGPAPTP